MPVRPAAAPPPFEIVRLSHLELGVRDLERSRAFYCDALGFVESAREEGRLYLRGLEERNHHSLVLVEGEPSARRLGWRVASEEGLEHAHHHLRGQGLPCAWVEVRHQGRTLHATDPFGAPLELVASLETAPRMLQRYGAYRGAMVQRIDHFNLFAADVQATHDWYAGLGFRTSEYTVTDDEDDPKLWAVWMQRKGNVHDLALTNGRGPRLHHLGVTVPSPMNILHACDVLATTGWVASLERGPGRHGISNAFFLYVRDPDGHRVELFASDYLTVDPDFEPIGWSLSDPQRQTLWGHPAPASWFEEGTPFADVPEREPVLAARPVVAV